MKTLLVVTLVFLAPFALADNAPLSSDQLAAIQKIGKAVVDTKKHARQQQREEQKQVKDELKALNDELKAAKRADKNAVRRDSKLKKAQKKLDKLFALKGIDVDPSWWDQVVAFFGDEPDSPALRKLKEIQQKVKQLDSEDEEAKQALIDELMAMTELKTASDLHEPADDPTFTTITKHR